MNRNAFYHLTVWGLLVSLLLSGPGPAWALRPMLDQSGVEEALREEVPVSSGVEETVLAPWKEEKSQEFQDRILQELGGSLTEGFRLRGYHSLTYGKTPVAVSSERFNLERWGVPAFPEPGEVALVRTGSVFFLDATRAAVLSPGLIKELGPHLIRIPNLRDYSVSRLHDSKNGKFGSHTHTAILSLLHTDLRDLAAVDLGSGDAVLAMVASRRGSGSLILVEKDPKQMQDARALLESNGLAEGKDFYPLVMDLRDPDGIEREIRRIVPPGRGIALIMNVGTWPGLYKEVSNANGIALAQRLPQVVRFVAGGYMGDTPGPAWRWFPRDALPNDQRALRDLSFDLDPNFSAFFDPQLQEFAVAFSASRSFAGMTAAAGAEEEVVFQHQIGVDPMMEQQGFKAIGLGKQFAPMNPLEAAAVKAFLRQDFSQLPEMDRWERELSGALTPVPGGFTKALTRQELEEFLQQAGSGANLLEQFAAHVFDRDPHRLQPPRDWDAAQQMEADYGFWTEIFRQALVRVGPPAAGAEEKFETPAEVLIYLLGHRMQRTFYEEVKGLGVAGRLVDTEGISLLPNYRIEFLYAASALDHAAEKVPVGGVLDLAWLRGAVPAPPAGLTADGEAKVLRGLLSHPGRPAGVKFLDWAQLLAVAYEGYGVVSGQSLERAASALDRLGDPPGGNEKTLKPARTYAHRWGGELHRMVEGEYLSALGANGVPTMEGLALYFLERSLADRLPKSPKGRQRVSPEGQPLVGLAPNTYLRYLPVLAHELFVPWLSEWTTAGAEERMTAAEFRQAYGREVLAAAGERASRISEWMSRADVKAVVINLPSQIPLYIQGDRVFWNVVDDLQHRILPGVVFLPIHLPTSNWNDFGMILRDPLFPEPENPHGLPVRSITPEEVSSLDPMELVLAVFRSRLNVPESQALGALTFRGADGQARLVLFSA